MDLEKEAIKIEAKILLLGNICLNCCHFIAQIDDNSFCALESFSYVNEYKKVKLDDTCKKWQAK